MKATLWDDLVHAKVVRERRGPLLKHLAWGLIFSPTFACVFWYRVNRWMYLHHFPTLFVRMMSVWRFYRFANDISYIADIGSGFMAGHVHGIVIGGYAKIGKRCLVRHNVTIGAANNDVRAMPAIGNDVEIGAHTIVIGNIKIGDRAKLGAMSLINTDVEADTLVFGVPPNQERRAVARIPRPDTTLPDPS